MQRDKRGRFVKKADVGTVLDGSLIMINGQLRKVKPGANKAYEFYKTGGGDQDFNTWLSTSSYLLDQNGFKVNTLPTDKDGKISLSLNTQPTLPAVDDYQRKMDFEWGKSNSINFMGNSINSGNPIFGDDHTVAPLIDVYRKEGKYVDSQGNELNGSEVISQPHKYRLVIDPSNTYADPEEDSEEDSEGITVVKNPTKQKRPWSINKTDLANWLEVTRAGISAHVNNKIAKRALEAEKPFLQDVSESHHNIYGDYRSKVRGEQAAAQLRNAASQPLTSDGALQQQMMLEAQIKGQEYIDSGNAADEATIRQTREIAWQQEKENQQQRQAVAMANRQAMLMSQKNKSQIENMRDSANFSQVVSPLLAATEQRLRNKGKEQEAYQEYYDNALVSNNVWNTWETDLNDTQKTLRNKYNSGGIDAVTAYIGTDETLGQEWASLQQIMSNEILRRRAALKGVNINLGNGSSVNNPYSMWEFPQLNYTSINKKGGTIYRAKLTKRTKDNDRGARSIESSKKIAARFLEKALNSLYTYDDVELIAKPRKKKRKYQAGGGLPFVNFTPIFATSETGATSQTQTKADSDEDLTTKDILTLLKDMDGLPSDMQIIVQSLRNFQMQDRMDPMGMSSSSDIASRYISLINKIKVANFNKNEYNQAFNQLKGNGGLNEFAITSEGLLIGTNAEGDFSYFSAKDVMEGKHKEEGYQLLTNSNLLYLRANSTEAAFNHKLTTVAQNGIGIETVNKLITDAIANLGTNTQSQEGYTKTRSGDLIQGLQDFYNAMEASGGSFDGTINDLYKYKYLTKSQAEQAKKAMQYIYHTLPENAKTLLKIKSDGSDSGAVKLIETLISSKESSTTQLDLELEGGKTAKSTSSKTNSDTDLKTSLPLNVMKNIGGQDSYIDVDRGDGIHMSLRGTAYNLIQTPNGEPIRDTSLATMLSLSGLQGIVADMRNIQFGDQVVSPEALQYITYNNTGVTRVNLPVKAGNRVNLDLLQKYEQAESELDLSGDKSKENVQKIYEKYGLLELLNADGSYNQSKFAPFIVTEGYTTDALSGVKTSDFVKEFTGNENQAIALMETSLAVGTGKNIVKPDIDKMQWYNPGDWFGWTDQIYKGVIYIPITNNVNADVLGANQTLDYDEALIQEEKYQNFEKMSHQRSTDSSILNI